MADANELQFISSLGAKLVLTAVAGQEAMSRPFSYRLELLCTDISLKLDPQELIGSAASIGIKYKETQFFRHGFILGVQLGTQRGRSRVVRMEVAPRLAFLKQSTDFRIFQNVTVVDVLKAVFAEFSVPSKLDNLGATTFPVMDMCVQCRETAFDFVSRLMEENGIFYYFTHAGVSEMVLGNAPAHYAQAEESDIGLAKDAKDGFMTQMEHGHDIRPAAFEVGDFSFATPTSPVLKNEPTFRLAPKDTYKRYAFPEVLPDATEAERIATVRMREEDAAAHVVSGAGEFVTFLPGHTFKLSKSDNIPYAEPLTSYVITSQQFTSTDKSFNHGVLDVLGGMLSPQWATDTAKSTGLGALGNAPTDTASLAASKIGGTLLSMATGGLGALGGALGNFVMDALKKIFEKTGDFSNQFLAIQIKTPFVPPRITPKPRIHGPHLATVVGAKGPTADDGQDICTDAFGRVHVKFPWDRAATDFSKGTSSAWIRVADGWAGSGWGMQFPPRVGQEVVVHFIDGDPDRPIITGRVYNGKNAQPFGDPGGDTSAAGMRTAAMVPSQRRSGIKTNSTPRPKGAKEKFNQIRFDDNWGKEQLAIRAQGRLDVFSYGASYHTSGGDRHIQVGGIDPQTGETSGVLYTHVFDEYDLHIGKDRYEYCEKTYQMQVKEDVSFIFQGAYATSVTKDIYLDGSSVVVSAAKKLTLSVGGNFVVIDSTGVSIKGTAVQINSGGSADPGPGLVGVSQATDATAADPGNA